MDSQDPSPGQADAAQIGSRNHVVVTGAGFNRALVPGAPLLVDDFNNDALEDTTDCAGALRTDTGGLCTGIAVAAPIFLPGWRKDKR